MTYDEAREKQRELEALLGHPGWKRLMATVEEQVRLRRQEDFNTSITGMGVMFKLASSRGEIAGLKLALTLPVILLEDLRADIADMLAVEREAERDSDREKED